ncbi:hypothetical protein [Paraburkholderia heleia]|uniref:hypothetical protein n=1 Tax=Paraburkholderia heleia TaxID=634127 RepID=UPI000B2C6F27|nr:hypothetical protein [Paraburkholderia heleia]
MPRIPQEELERIKHEVSLLRLIESQGHELKKRGKGWVIRGVYRESGHEHLNECLIPTHVTRIVGLFARELEGRHGAEYLRRSGIPGWL